VNKFSKPRRHFKIFAAKRVTCSKFYTEEPQMLGATVQNSDATATWRPGVLYPF